VGRACISTSGGDNTTNCPNRASNWGFSVQGAAPPAVTSITPTTGVASGGTSVQIKGTNFTSDAVVKFGSAPTPPITFNSATSITATSPAGSGVVDVTVTTAAGTSATGAFDQFTYTAVTGAPVITSVSPKPVIGSTKAQTLTITGNNFASRATVTLRDLTAGKPTLANLKPTTANSSGTQLTVSATFGIAADNWSAEVINPNGQSSGQFAFQVVAPPTPALSVTPSNAPVGAPAGCTSFSVSNTGAGTLSYSATVHNTPWLSIVSGASGGNSGIIKVRYSANTGAQRSGTIQVTSKGAVGSPATLTVIQAPPALGSSPLSGKGDWIWFIDDAIKAIGGSKLQDLINYESCAGIQYLIVKAGEGNHPYPNGATKTKLDAN
jgi:hypothetical protein